jgi:hypothetical protein
MCTKTRAASTVAGSTLIEALIATGITALLILVLMSLTMFSGRAFAAFYNYVDLDDHNKIAMDTLTSDLRECNRLIAFTTTEITMEDSDGVNISYTYTPSDETLVRRKNGIRKTLLTGCDMLKFVIAQRNPVGYTYEAHYEAATPATAKVVQVSWNCSRTILGQKVNTESVQTARIVIRKQG